MKPGLQLKLSQHLTLTPQLQQSIKLLQLSTVELNQELERYLTDNPLLERIDIPGDDVPLTIPGISAQGSGTTSSSAPAESESDDTRGDGNDFSFGDDGGGGRTGA